MTQAFFPEQQQWRQIECRGFFPCEVWGKSFVSRVFTKKTRVCLPLLLLQNGLSETYLAQNQGKNAE